MGFDGYLPIGQTDMTDAKAVVKLVEEVDEAELLIGLKARDSAAFRQAVVVYSPQMLATARRIVGSADAEDLVQESWLTVFNKIDGFEGRAKLSTWLTRIVANRAISSVRNKPKEQSLSNDHGSDPSASWFDDSGHWIARPTLWNPGTPEQLLDTAELQKCLDNHLDKMPDNQRKVLLLRDTHEKSFEQICNSLELSASNARVMLHRGRLKLMEMVNNFQETGTC